MNGIINILKPPGMTSFDVVGFLRGVTRIKKIGHTGTLDPGAVGVLPVCIGSATKVIEYITAKDKKYRAEVVLGFSTDTQDSTGTVLTKREVNITQKDIDQCIISFVGEIKQLPPMYSAVKVNGKKLYELARQGIEVEREARAITVYSIKCVKELFVDTDGKYKFMMDVHCSKGTYIRTLCHDIGEMLGCGGNMAFLIRTNAGSFDLENSLTLQEVADSYRAGEIEKFLLSPEKVFEDLNSITLDETETKKFLNGVVLKEDCSRILNSTGAVVTMKQNNQLIIKVYTGINEFLGLGLIKSKVDGLYLKSEKLF